MIWGFVKDIISRLFNYTEQNGYFKTLIKCVLEINGRQGGRGDLLPLNPFWLIKSALALSISNQMSFFRSFYDNKWPS